MKNVIKILLLALICMAITCDPIPKESENCHTAIKFSNNSEKDLRVRDIFLHYILFPDPLNIKGLSYTARNDIYVVKSGEQDNRKATLGSGTTCIEDIFKREGYTDTIFVYVFDAAVVENTPWEVVTRDYLVLKRYDLTLENLQRLDWKITYPPTEAMKNVKQYPPYGE